MVTRKEAWKLRVGVLLRLVGDEYLRQNDMDDSCGREQVPENR